MKRGESSSQCDHTSVRGKNKPGGQRLFERSGEQFLGGVVGRTSFENALSCNVATGCATGCRLGLQREAVARSCDRGGRRKASRCCRRGGNERGNALGCRRRVNRGESLWRCELPDMVSDCVGRRTCFENALSCKVAIGCANGCQHKARISSGGSTRQEHTVIVERRFGIRSFEFNGSLGEPIFAKSTVFGRIWNLQQRASSRCNRQGNGAEGKSSGARDAIERDGEGLRCDLTQAFLYTRACEGSGLHKSLSAPTKSSKPT